MADFKHGISTREVPTPTTGLAQLASALPFVVGTAPINLVKPRISADQQTDYEHIVNRPILINSYDECIEKFGLEKPKSINPNGTLKRYTYTLNEFSECNFKFYNQGPLIFVNVLDPAKHKKAADTQNVTFDATTGIAKIKEQGILVSTLKISKTAGGFYTVGNGANDDCIASFDEDGYLVLTSNKQADNFKVETAQQLTITVEKIDPTLVTKADIIGGIDATTKKSKGLECLTDVYQIYGKVPSLVLAPRYCEEPEVASVMAVKAQNYNGKFNAIALVDLDCTTHIDYSSLNEYKNKENLVDPNMYLLWPKVTMGDVVYSLSCHAFGVIAKSDEQDEGIPCSSPSNKKYAKFNGLCANNGTEIILNQDKATSLNSVGITTATNTNGWQLWGNRTACYPGNLDTKDNFINIRRMFIFLRNEFVVTFQSQIDTNISKSFINRVVTTYGNRLSSLTNSEKIAGGRIAFLKEENPAHEIAEGHVKFRVDVAPFAPAESISADFGLDTSYYTSLA